LSLRASRLWRSVPNAPAVAFDRTADLYHVKADWPHKDTRGRIQTSVFTQTQQIKQQNSPVTMAYVIFSDPTALRWLLQLSALS